MNWFNSLTGVQKNLLVAILAMILFILSTSVSYSAFAVKPIATPLLTGALPGPSGGQEDEQGPKTESCPLNGTMHSSQAREAWDRRRPLSVMIENSVEARPQSGLSYADVVYEAVAEGGITRFLALYYCNSLPDVQVGPVRSARTYFLDWVSEYDALYAHVGGANTPGPANALGQIIDYKIKDLNQFSISFPTFWRDSQRLKKKDGTPVAIEHTMYSTTHKLWDVAEKRGWSNPDSGGNRWTDKFKKWKFKNGQPNLGQVNKIDVRFWEGVGYASDYNVTWTYDGSCNCYKRKNGGIDQIDLDNNQQLSASNVVVQYMVESQANDGYENNVHLLYKNKGQGKAIIFQDGKAIVGSWVKKDRLAREKFLDESGKEIAFNRGVIWIQTVPEGSTVAY